jgi:hypothetical protein
MKALAFVVLAAAGTPALSLANGQARWFAPGQLRTGALVRCIAGGHTAQAPVPAPPARDAVDDGVDWTAHGVQLRIARRWTGATEVACGDADVAPHRAQPPYVIGQNGLALIRGKINLAALTGRFGQPLLRTRGGSCRADWPALGLVAVLGGTCDRGGPLHTATVTDPRWTSLLGVRVGDALARMRWEVPGAKRAGVHRWQLSKAVASNARLFATTGRAGRVVRLTCVLG